MNFKTLNAILLTLIFYYFFPAAQSAVSLKELKNMAAKFKNQMNDLSYKQTKRNLLIKFVDDSIFAYADYNATQNIITVSPMIANEINHYDEFSQVLCHELGHFIAGNPMDERLKRNRNGSYQRSVFSAEGQAEYFSSFCLKQNWVNADEQTNLKKFNELTSFFEFPQEAASIKKICPENNYLCMRILGVHYLTKFKMSLFKGKKLVSFSDPDLRIMPFTIQGLGIYPSPQCLLDNGVASVLCQDDMDQFLKLGSCLDLKFTRPACWFKQE